MSIGNSGRIVLEIDPLLKKQLYQALKVDGLNMKEWFLEQANELLNKEQLSFELDLPKEREKQ
ncbi:hypothetical protein [Kangiella sediminilitoris]|uniref:Uncharacterized protein n=1 Tax=Kangiella sediminilitoris TaxID=1144748 RepID=A0A1B3B9N1_9GAMM|nr:hypothetical protein [Kangiella sediminilitoris]AOE49509.1 hypothetical protein KS2013_785 [Kangiella sediminilitoris]